MTEALLLTAPRQRSSGLVLGVGFSKIITSSIGIPLYIDPRASSGPSSWPRPSASSSRSTRPGRPRACRRWRRCAMSDETCLLRSPGRFPAGRRSARRRAPGAAAFSLALLWEVVRTAAWSSSGRTSCARLLTLTLLMLGVFALVVMTSVLDGVMDKIATGFAGMSWDGTVMLAPKAPETTEEQKRFAMSPGLRYEDLPRLTAPHPKVLAFLPRAHQAAPRSGSPAAPSASSSPASRPTTPLDEPADRAGPRPDRGRRAAALHGRRRRRDARLQALRRRGPRGPRHHRRGRPLPDRRRPGPAARSSTRRSGTTPTASSIPLETYMDRMDPDHKLAHVAVKLAHEARTWPRSRP